MGRTKTKLRKYVRRRNVSTVELSGKHVSGKNAGFKRPFEKTPIKSPSRCCIKSPFRSPLYKASPLCKKVKSSRQLFDSRGRRSELCLNEIPSERKKTTSVPKHIKCAITPNLEDTKTSKSYVKEFELLSDSTESGEDSEDANESSSHNLGTFFNKSPSSTPSKSKSHCKEHVSIPTKSFDHSGGQFTMNSPGNSTKSLSDTAEKMIRLIPTVLQNLSKKDGLDSVIVNFFEMVAADVFPLDNIAFMLWSEVVRWFSCQSTTQMRYSEETKMFWKLGWRIFGKRFVNFMGGFKSHGEIALQKADRGYYCPESSEINFAVPDVSILREFKPYQELSATKPGIFNDSISFLSDHLKNKSACITFDGKKLKQGLTPDSGDVNLLGFEKGPSLQEKTDSLYTELDSIDQMKKLVGEMKDLTQTNTLCNSYCEICGLENFLMKHLLKISESVNAVEKIKVRKEYCKTKLIERGGDTEWRKGRYAFAISAVTAFIHDIDEYVHKANCITETICRQISFFHDAKYIEGVEVNLNEDIRYISIDHQSGEEKSTRLLKQRTNEWHVLRAKAKVTGSTLYKAAGCEGIGKQREHFEKVICHVPEKEPNSIQKAAMDHGTQNEINAVASIVGKILPVVEPALKFCEEGCITVKKEDGSLFMIVSPDGSLRKSSELSSSEVAVEIKCPVKVAHSEFPERYLLQCLAEIEALSVRYLLYVSWHKDITTVFKVYRNRELFQKAMKICMNVYGSDNPKKPTKLTPEIKDLKEEISKESKNVTLVGRFQSCFVTDKPNVYSNDKGSAESLSCLLENIADSIKNCYELQREKASEAVVFLLADLDRSSSRNAFRCSPIAWFPKGYSLDVNTMRRIADKVHTTCTKAGIHVPCQSFDGQWHPLVIRAADDYPLTVYQLQKDTWREIEKMNKKDIILQFMETNISVNWSFAVKDTEGKDVKRYILATNNDHKLPVYRRVVVTEDTIVEPYESEVNVNLANAIPVLVQEANNISESVLAMSSITEDIEFESFASNVNDEQWSQELELLQKSEIQADTQLQESQKKNCGEGGSTEFTLDMNDMACLLALLRTTKDCNKNQKRDNHSPTTLMENFGSVSALNRFLDVELRVIVRYLRKNKGQKTVKESSTKQIKLKGIASLLNLDINTTINSQKVRRRSIVVTTLKELAKRAVGKYTKHELNVIMAEYTWDKKYAAWRKNLKANSLNGKEHQWFYLPEYSQSRNQLEVKCIDSTHLLTRMRRKTCSGGMERLTNESWVKVAKQKRTLLTPIMVEDVTDPMSAAMAITHFSLPVENEMRKNGDTAAASLCYDIRCWWEAEDSPGIPSATRVAMREPLRTRLVSKVDFSRFPPPTQYVDGWPAQLWEALLASIDAKAYLYSLAHGGSYNVRAFSSLIGETFFSELTLNDKSGHGTVTAKEFGQYVGYTTEQLQIRLDRLSHCQYQKFSYCTSKKKVYNVVDESYECKYGHDNTCRVCRDGFSSIPSCIYTRDNEFDAVSRKHLPGRRKEGTVSTDRNAVLKGTLGVRWEKARRNDSKLLTTKRICIE